jgi:hypothetical protein
MSVNDASRIMTDNSSGMLQIVVSLNDGSRGVIYNCNMFIVKAIGLRITLGRLGAEIIN